MTASGDYSGLAKLHSAAADAQLQGAAALERALRELPSLEHTDRDTALAPLLAEHLPRILALSGGSNYDVDVRRRCCHALLAVSEAAEGCVKSMATTTATLPVEVTSALPAPCA